MDKSGFDFSVPEFPRHAWPKELPKLTLAQMDLADDFVKYWHQVLPRSYGLLEKFNHHYPLKYVSKVSQGRTLELGAGLGGHLVFEDLVHQEYHCVELRENMANVLRSKFPGVSVIQGNCQERLPLSSGYFDRIIAIHVLEHLTDLPRALNEVFRLLKSGGLFTVVIPCDPGFLYEVARKLSAERLFRRRYNIPYKWFARREHINSPSEIIVELRRSLCILDITYFPFVLPSINSNICIGVTATKHD